MKNPRVVVFQSAENLNWYWHLQAPNGKIICTGEGHRRKSDCYRALHNVMDTLLRAEVEEKQ